ncbi:hypothetical protein GCM10023205_81820 [Yinghuangia aomiensis]|uniref:Uncharacterized protein n=1 Tax=Yinghuangia aomiensis TaxID=676205 RepID=A0ABP9IFW4_9ACTN
MVDLERGFRKDSERDQIEVVWDEYEDKADVLAGALDACHGAHRTVALGSYFERAIAGEDVPEPLDHLSGLVVQLHVWTLAERRLAIRVGQHDKELPIQLIADAKGRQLMASIAASVRPLHQCLAGRSPHRGSQSAPPGDGLLRRCSARARVG